MTKDITNYSAMKEVLCNLDDNIPVYLVGHMNTDYDSVGSALALTLFLRKLNKRAFMLLEEKDIPMLDWFGDTDYILTEKEEIQKPYNIIQLDGNKKQRLGVFEKYFDEANLKINIDHHENNSMQADYILAIGELSSTAEILCGLFELFDTEIDKSIAGLLFAGMVSDTYSFLQRTTKETMQFGSKLLEYGIDNQYIIKSVYLDKNENELEILADMLSNITKACDGFDYIFMDKDDETTPYKGDIYNFIYKKTIPTIQNIVGQEVLGLFLKSKGLINGEFRCNTNLDVEILAKEFGGGGHKNASGFTTDKSLEEVIEISKEYILASKVV